MMTSNVEDKTHQTNQHSTTLLHFNVVKIRHMCHHPSRAGCIQLKTCPTHLVCLLALFYWLALFMCVSITFQWYILVECWRIENGFGKMMKYFLHVFRRVISNPAVVDATAGATATFHPTTSSCRLALSTGHWRNWRHDVSIIDLPIFNWPIYAIGLQTTRWRVDNNRSCDKHSGWILHDIFSLGCVYFRIGSIIIDWMSYFTYWLSWNPIWNAEINKSVQSSFDWWRIANRILRRWSIKPIYSSAFQSIIWVTSRLQ